MPTINIDHLRTILGEQLSSVVFVQDYLQLDFDGNLLTCYKWPIIVLSAALYNYGETEYRNAICAFITSNVLDVKSTDGEVLIEFSVGTIVFVMQGDEEVIYFTDNNKKWSYYPCREQ